ncbi:ricin B lectin domain-containing protein [Mycena latifolia]|nr:ricin B lectin domain-containing protein [Mycena latifolia]
MAPTHRFTSLVFATIYLSLHANAQVPVFHLCPVGGCLTASSNADGAPVIIQDCPVGAAPSVSNTWVAAAGVGKAGALKIFGDKCLDMKDGVDGDGTKLQIWTCASGNTNQQWVSAGSPGSPQIVWAGKNKCVDVTNGNVTNGNVMQIWDCDASFSNPDQNWGIAIVTQPKSVSLSLASDTSLCIAASANSTSAPVTIENCSSNSPMQTWIGSSVGIIKSCIDLTDGKKTAGTQLQIWNCTAGNTNQNWVVSYNF